MLRRSLPLAVKRTRIRHVGRAGIIFGNVRQLWRLLAVHGSGAGQEKCAGPALSREIERVPRALDDGIEHQQRIFGVPLGAGFGGGVDDVGEMAAGKDKIADVTLVAGNGRIGGQLRDPRAEGLPVARQDDRLRAERELPVRPGEAL